MKHAERWLVVALCAAIGWFYVWTVRSSGEEWSFGEEQRDYYNLLIDGYLDGQLHMKVEVPPALLSLRNPYDPEERPPGLGMHDASFYQGKYYVYFGAAPMVVLMLPFRLLTGMDLPLAVAVLTFVYAGFLVSVALFLALRRRYFLETAGAGTVLVGVLVLGIAGLCPVLLRRPDMWELPIAGGYFFAMLALACVWRSMHSEHARGKWFAGAGLCVGFAIASRPTYLMAVPLLVPPLWWWWRSERRLPWRLVFSAGPPLAVVGALMAAHNFARFDDPLEFGQAYQFSLDYESKLPHFSARYIPFTAKAHFFSAARWSPYFPFIHRPDLGKAPAGFTNHRGDVYGILTNFPIAWLAFLSPLALWRRSSPDRGPLAAWVASVVLLFGLVAGFLLFFFSALARYQMDFVPALMLLAVVGLLALERGLRVVGTVRWRRMAATGWTAAALFSAGFGVVFSLGFDGLLREHNPVLEQQVARTLNRMPAAFERALGVQHGPIELILRLSPDARAGRELLLTLGDGANCDRVFVQYNSDGRVQFGVSPGGRAELVSRPLSITRETEHRVEVTLAALYPPSTHPFFEDKSHSEVNRIRDFMRIKVDGEPVLMARQRSRHLGSAQLRVGHKAAAVSPDARFRGEIVAIRRVTNESASLPASGSFVRVRVGLGTVPLNACEPLVSYGDARTGMLLGVTRLSADELEFSFAGAGTEAASSGVISFRSGHVNEIVVRMTAEEKSGQGRIYVWLDGQLIWAPGIAIAAGDLGDVVAGRNTVGAPQCATEFRGEITNVQQDAGGRDPLEGPGDTLRIRLRLVPQPRGTREPIVVTGGTGYADTLMVEYVDGQSVRFGLDHWGAPMRMSKPVHFDYSVPHDLEISMSSLEAVEDAPALAEFRSGRLRLKVDGREVWEDTSEFFVTEPGEMAIGRNAVGATTCAPWFSGDILSAERVVRE